MKNFVTRSLLATAGIALLSTAAIAQTGNNRDCADCEMNGYARVIRPIDCRILGHMNVGAIYSDADGGTVTIVPNNSTVQEGPARTFVGLLGVSPTGPNAAANNDLLDNDGIEQCQISVTGEAGFSYNLSVAYAPNWINGTNNMAVSNITFAGVTGFGTFTSPNGVLPGTIGSGNAGTSRVNVGATLTLSGNQAPGRYAGVIGLVTTYN